MDIRTTVTNTVAPRAGAGIEICWFYDEDSWGSVAPRAGAGIEIKADWTNHIAVSVAPRAGAGIEIIPWPPPSAYAARRPSRRGGN